MLIAEVGCNHKGDLDIAKEMIMIAAQFCQADVVKFQKRTNKELLTEAEYNAPHPNPAFSYGDSYGEHREFLEFDVDTHRELIDSCEKWHIEYMTSVWDLTAAQEIASLQPKRIKIPSACNCDGEMLHWLFEYFPGEIHVSLGMTSRAEEEQLVNWATEHGRMKDVIIYACTSDYPVEFKDICLLEITRLRDAYGDHAKAIGFSGHHSGIAADIAGLALGATWFERHFTLNRTWKGTDHAASLEPDGMRRLARDLRNVALALRNKESEILATEHVQRAKLKRCIQ